MKAIKYLFWNLQKKNLIGPLVQIILENSIDIVALIETEKIDLQGVINSLKMQSQEWRVLEVCPKAPMRVLAKAGIKISVHIEEKRFSSYRIKENKEVYLMLFIYRVLYT